MASSQSKIVSLPTLKRAVRSLKKQGKTIAFTNGCFDILHFGHVSYLEKAKKVDRILIVGLNSDRSVRRIKGSKRPILPQKQRAGVLAALSCVDFVVIFSQESPQRLIQEVQPDVLIKGADWRGKNVVGSDTVESTGGKVEFIHYLPGLSTTNVIETILNKCRKS